MKILALDLGKFKTVACHYQDGKHHFETLQTAQACSDSPSSEHKRPSSSGVMLIQIQPGSAVPVQIGH